MNARPMRIAAFGLAALAVADPAISTSRSSRPIVAVVTPDSAPNGGLQDRIDEVLDRRFTIVRGKFDAAAATVIAGPALPDDAGTMGGSVFAVLPPDASPSVRLTEIETPPTSRRHARSPIGVTVSTHGATGRTLTTELTDAGVVVGQMKGLVLIDSGTVQSLLDYLPVTDRLHVLGVHARIEGTTASDSAFAVVDVRNDRFPVLFYDAFPSWTSTFVRRAVQEDPRFSVTHRVVTSRGVSNTAGEAPPSPGDSESLSRFATIVVGVPENLRASDVRALEIFMRRRAGRVVAFINARGAGPLDRLAGVSSWRTMRSNAPSRLGHGELMGREFVWPSIVPPDATVHLRHVTRDSVQRPIVWSVPVGAGRLLLSGALDAWEHRADSSGFNEFWTNTLAELTDPAPEAVTIELSRRLLRPGETTQARVTIREVMLSNSAFRTAAVRAALISDGDSSLVRLWPDQVPGVLNGTIIAPRKPGVHRLLVWSGEDRVESSIVVDAEKRTLRHDDRAIIEAFVSSRGGDVVAGDDLSELPDRLSSAIQVVPRVETWHPMRSPWWIVPFALLLGAEWWSRRRRGLA